MPRAKPVAPGIYGRLCIAAAALLGSAALGLFLRYLLEYRGWGIPCPLLAFTGLYCPGCGAARALVAASRFRLRAALGYNPLVILLLPLLVVLLAAQLRRYVLWGRRFDAPSRCGPLELSLIGIAVLFGIARNIPFFAFLAPTL